MYQRQEPAVAPDGFDPKAWVARAVAWERNLGRLRQTAEQEQAAGEVASLGRARRAATEPAARKPKRKPASKPKPASAA